MEKLFYFYCLIAVSGAFVLFIQALEGLAKF
jgi:hypothetical protein